MSYTRLNKISQNVSELLLANGKSVLFSYHKPVAGYNGTHFIYTEDKDSKTTTKHINAYLPNSRHKCQCVPQIEIENLLV